MASRVDRAFPCSCAAAGVVLRGSVSGNRNLQLSEYSGYIGTFAFVSVMSPHGLQAARFTFGRIDATSYPGYPRLRGVPVVEKELRVD